MRTALLACVAAMACGACGGGATLKAPEAPAASTSAPPATTLTPAETPAPTVSTVRFDDLGMSFAVPAGFRVLGDDEIAKRVRASSAPAVRGVLADAAAMRRGIPLLALARAADATHGALDVTLSAVAVPADATPAELLAQQRSLLERHLAGLEVTAEAAAADRDGVPGAEMRHAYTLGRGEKRRVRAILRAHVRAGLAVVTSAVWPDAGSDGDRLDAETVLDGLHFTTLPAR